MSDTPRRPAAGTELSGWKQIASHLGVSVPTARKYHRDLGLPVIERNGRYFAFTGDLDHWKRGAGSASGPPRGGDRPPVSPLARPPAAGPAAGRLGARALAVVLLVLLAGAFFASRVAQRRHGDLAYAVVRGHYLVATDASGTELWRRRFAELGSPQSGSLAPLIRDVDHDGHKEVLLDVSNSLPGESRGRLICLDHHGKLVWQFVYGRDLTVAGRHFAREYVGHHLRWVESSGRSWVLVDARQATWFPTQVVLLDPASGAVVSEYWHPGYLASIATADLDGDGKNELLLGGVNNPGDGPGHASLAVLDLPFGPPHGGHNYFGHGNAIERAYLLFPRSDVFRILPELLLAEEIRILGGKILQVGVGAAGTELFFRLDPELRVLDVRPSDSFVILHDQLFSRGLLDHRYQPEERSHWRHVLRLPTAPDGNRAGIRRQLEPGGKR